MVEKIICDAPSRALEDWTPADFASALTAEEQQVVIDWMNGPNPRPYRYIKWHFGEGHQALLRRECGCCLSNLGQEVGRLLIQARDGASQQNTEASEP